MNRTNARALLGSKTGGGLASTCCKEKKSCCHGIGRGGSFELQKLIVVFSTVASA